MRKKITATVLLVTLGCICALFWYCEWQYILPTPKPAVYSAVNTKEQIDLSGKFSFDYRCTRFNVTHFRSLNETYAVKTSFAVVVKATDMKNNYAQIAIDVSLACRQEPAFDQFVLTVCCCALPTFKV